jgi:hypothetical protein
MLIYIIYIKFTEQYMKTCYHIQSKNTVPLSICCGEITWEPTDVMIHLEFTLKQSLTMAQLHYHSHCNVGLKSRDHHRHDYIIPKFSCVIG